MKSFFQEAINSLNTSGTIYPSSKYLIKRCLKDLELDTAKVVVEFGAGNGCITQALQKRIGKDTLLYSFEINPKFHSFCKDKFQEYENIQIVQESALDFEKFLIANNITEVDYFISSLPLSFFKNEKIAALFAEIMDFLPENGRFVQYQYSIGKYQLIKEAFNQVDIGFTLFNIPPAFTYKCYPQK